MRTLDVILKNNEYRIYIQRGLLNSLGKNINEIYKGKRIIIVTDWNVEKFHLDTLIKSLKSNGFITEVFSIRPGEHSKTIETLQEIYKKLCESQVKRSELIVSFGGGVIGDLTGFAAATYLRGIKYIQVPTTLLAQIDSSIGGKVGVDLPYGKNLVGSFYQPQAVFIDPEVLKTLDKKIFNDGMSEIIKYGLIRDVDIVNSILNYDTVEKLIDDIEEIIYKCCYIKKTIVEKDEKEIGERMLLNFGHTLGHCIEKYFNYEIFTHGEAVAIGMAHITKKSEELGITEKGTYAFIKNILRKFDLPIKIPDANFEELFEIIKYDKKSLEGSINLILLTKVGEGIIFNSSMKYAEDILFNNYSFQK